MLDHVYKKLKTPFTFAILVLLSAVIIIIFASHILYKRTVNLLADNLRERILSISITEATNIDPKDLDALHVQEDWKKEEWTSIVTKLNRAKYSNKDVVFMYIFRKIQDNPQKMEFVADADSLNPFAYTDVNQDGMIEPEGPDKLQWPGQPYPEANNIPEAFEAYDKPLTTKELYTDEYGTVITGYAPIKDEFGNTVAVLATDIRADDFFINTTQTLKPFIGFIIFLTVIVSILIIIVIFVWKRYSESLEKLNYERSEFVSVAHHHIATPLTILKGYVSMIGKNNNDPKILSILEQSTKNLIQIIRDFVNAYRIDDDETNYHFRTENFTVLLKNLIEEFRPLFAKKEVTIIDDIPNEILIVNICKERLIQAISAVFKNSLKYVIKGNIDVHIDLSNKFVTVYITDNAIRNVPDVSKNLLFKFSKKGDQKEANIISKDFALYSTKKIVEMHGGDFTIIQTHSKRDVPRVTFLFTLPLK